MEENLDDDDNNMEGIAQGIEETPEEVMVNEEIWLLEQKPTLPETIPPQVELKPLSPNLKYAFLGPDSTFPVIINASLTEMETQKLIKELRAHRKVIGYTIDNIKGISPSICMRKILLEEGYKNSIEHQRRLNPNLKEVVKKEVLKLLDVEIIYPISDSEWVSPVHVVPKRGGMMVIKNESNDLIPTRTVTGWRMCIDYRKINKETRKDHFPLPFIDEMLERLAKHSYFCYLDGYSEKIMEVFMDDFSVYGNDFDSCLLNLSKVLQRCEDVNLVLNWEKCHFMVKEGIILGHKISERGIEVDKAKIETIEKLPLPHNNSALMMTAMRHLRNQECSYLSPHNSSSRLGTPIRNHV
ncbi:uncharacterized protein LOC121999533 [Zingiber officinale]|uniref:uncharacterized protein LOC121999533 n=1 Tax=Zingiber officinale TaxID=94328 RepID=UPI001C4D58E4|nr:uncharacterized protein LOC121999533 [Zingiber officinale]